MRDIQQYLKTICTGTHWWPSQKDGKWNLVFMEDIVPVDIVMPIYEHLPVVGSINQWLIDMRSKESLKTVYKKYLALDAWVSLTGIESLLADAMHDADILINNIYTHQYPHS